LCKKEKDRREREWEPRKRKSNRGPKNSLTEGSYIGKDEHQNATREGGGEKKKHTEALGSKRWKWSMRGENGRPRQVNTQKDRISKRGRW